MEEERKKASRLGRIACAVALGLSAAGCSSHLDVREVRDFTGDGIPDILMNLSGAGTPASDRGDYLFIDNGDGTFIRTQKKRDSVTKIEYLLADDGNSYFFDGEFYRLSPKQE